jgi:Uma2 family endonuclease
MASAIPPHSVPRLEAEVLRRLPAGSALRLDEVEWEEYEELLRALGPAEGKHVFYDQGRLEVLSPTAMQERQKIIIHEIIAMIGYEFGIPLACYGSTPLRHALTEAGAGPADCFYVQQAARIIGKPELNLAHDPPPDLVVEAVYANASLEHFALYARLGVPEIWRVSAERAQFYLLRDGHYEQAASSLAFPFLLGAALFLFLEYGLAHGEQAAALAFRDWLRTNRQAFHPSGGSWEGAAAI